MVIVSLSGWTVKSLFLFPLSKNCTRIRRFYLRSMTIIRARVINGTHSESPPDYKSARPSLCLSKSRAKCRKNNIARVSTAPPPTIIPNSDKGQFIPPLSTFVLSAFGLIFTKLYLSLAPACLPVTSVFVSFCAIPSDTNLIRNSKGVFAMGIYLRFVSGSTAEEVVLYPAKSGHISF